MSEARDTSSFRDPNSFIVVRDNSVERFFSESGEADFLACESTGLFTEIVSKELLLSYTKIKKPESLLAISVKKLPFICYVNEWCFEQLKAAALLTVKIELTSLEYGCTLKYASSYNVQFEGAFPRVIDH